MIAQRIAQQSSPALQAALDSVRRSILEEINQQRSLIEVSSTNHKALFHPVPLRARVLSWDSIRITPEVDQDRTLTGLCISTLLAKELRHLHQSQISIITKEVR